MAISRIAFIKFVREMSGMSLVESKDLVDAFWETMLQQGVGARHDVYVDVSDAYKRLGTAMTKLFEENKLNNMNVGRLDDARKNYDRALFELKAVLDETVAARFVKLGSGVVPYFESEEFAEIKTVLRSEPKPFDGEGIWTDDEVVEEVPLEKVVSPDHVHGEFYIRTYDDPEPF